MEMTIERLEGMLEEVREAETLPELKELYCLNEAAGCSDPEVVRAMKMRLPELRLVGKPEEVPNMVEQLPRLRSMPPQATKVYRFLSADVSWSTVPQVHAIVEILSAHGPVGSVWTEDQIIQMMEANVRVLATVQGGKRIWKYYKGKHDRGLEAHGNIEEVR